MKTLDFYFKYSIKNGYCLGAYNFVNMEVLKGICMGSAKTNSPCLTSVSEGALKYMGEEFVLNLFKSAKYIYKLDEDIFVTKDYFKTLMKTMNDCDKSGDYKVGFVAPTIPINGFGNLLVLKRFNLVDIYTKKFEKPLYAAGGDRMIENNPNVAKFFWGYENYVPKIDEMNKIVQNDKFDYVACPIRFSIGAILFKRKLWEEMNMFEVKKGSGMGSDEKQICQHCMIKSRPIIVSKNSIVGHLSFGKQNEAMEKYFKENKDFFNINN